MVRREFLATIAMVGAGLAKATTASVADKRVFLAGFSPETNTFHPVLTTSFHCRTCQSRSTLLDPVEFTAKLANEEHARSPSA